MLKRNLAAYFAAAPADAFQSKGAKPLTREPPDRFREILEITTAAAAAIRSHFFQHLRCPEPRRRLMTATPADQALQGMTA